MFAFHQHGGECKSLIQILETKSKNSSWEELTTALSGRFGARDKSTMFES